MSEKSILAWACWDTLIEDASPENPWRMTPEGVAFNPDFPLLERLLAVPIALRLLTKSGLPAKAVDYWIAEELRRAGFGADVVWPRRSTPRVVGRDALRVAESLERRAGVTPPKALTAARVGSADARILGRNYFKQVDVVISDWTTGPELLISTKRMDSSFSNNALNRVEEAYGDAKNLRARHPLAALGFVYMLRSTALDEDRASYEKIVDLLQKMGREEDAYTATALILPSWTSESDAEVPETTDEVLAALPDVTLKPPGLSGEITISRFFDVIIRHVLGNCPVSEHEKARALLAEAHGPVIA